jgi:hypothetical protein
MSSATGTTEYTQGSKKLHFIGTLRRARVLKFNSIAFITDA